ncbi:MAG: trehalase family glycosidase [Chloroflexota bacterium]
MPHFEHLGPPDSAAAKNPFLKKSIPPFQNSLMGYQEAKALLPEPVLPQQGGLLEMYWRAWEMAWSNLHRASTANGLITPYARAVGRPVVSVWDSCFVALYGLYGRRAFDFIGALDNFYARQLADGFIGREYSTVDGEAVYYPYGPNATGPNFMAWVEWRHYRMTGDHARIEQVFWPLLALHRWYRANRTWPSGLYWATGVSSGMDNQPRVPDSQFHHRHWTWVDATMQAILNCRVLEQLALLLGEPELGQELADERAVLISLVNEHLWQEAAGFYQDVDANGRFSPIKSIGAYWALLDKDIVPEKRLEPFLRHLRENWAFNMNHRVPSQSADSEGYNPDSGNGWRGGVWPPLNYIVTRGLQNVGQDKLAHQIAVNHLQNMWEVYQHTDTIWDHYAPERPSAGEHARSDFVGPSGIAPITMLLEDVIGIRTDWPLRRVTWRRMLDCQESYGVRNYPFGPEGAFELVGDCGKVVVTTDTPLTLNIHDNGYSIQTAVPVGRTEIDMT